MPVLTSRESSAFARSRASAALRRVDIRHWFLGLSLILCAPAVLAEGCRFERIAAVDLLVTNSGRVQIPVDINGVHVQMGIEVGSALSAIWTGAAAALNLKSKETIALGQLRAGSVPLTQTINIKSFKTGNLRWSPFSILVYPRNEDFSQSL